MQFNGTDQYVDCGIVAIDVGMEGGNDKTVMAWAYCSDFTDVGGVWSLGTGGTTGADFTLRPDGTTDDWRTNHWGAADYVFTTPTTSLNVWWHFAVTYDGTTSITYGNGEVMNSSVVALSTGEVVGLNVARWYQGGQPTANHEFFNGRVADVRVYSRTLGQEEIQSIYRARGRDSSVLNLQGRWTLSNGSIGGLGPLSHFVDESQTVVASSTSIVLTVPTNTDGDLMIACITATNATGTAPNMTQASWTLIITQDIDTGAPPSVPSMWMFRRTASSEPASYSFTSDTTASMVGHMYVYRNVQTTEDATASNSGSSASPSCPSVATGGGTFLAIRMIASDSEQIPADPTLTFSNGVNNRFATETTGGLGNGCSMAVADHVRSGTTSRTETFALAATDMWGTFTVTFASTLATLHDLSGSLNAPHEGDPQNGPIRVVDEMRI